MPSSSPLSFADLADSEEHILLSAVDAASFQDIVNQAGPMLNAVVIVADSLHYLLAITGTPSDTDTASLSWLDLIDAGYVPPVKDPLPRDLTSSGLPHPSFERVGASLIVHKDLVTQTGQFCTMCDILDHGSTVLKLAVTAQSPLDAFQRKLFLTLAATLHLVYLRLGTSFGLNDRARHLLELLETGKFPEPRLSYLNSTDFSGPFQLLCFQTEHLGVHNLSFISTFPDIAKSPHLLSAVTNGGFVLLLSGHPDNSALLSRLDRFACEHGFPILLSQSFSDLRASGRCFREVSRASDWAARLQGLRGIHSWQEFAMFLMFDAVRQTTADTLCHPDVQILADHDQAKGTEYVQTVYCYLLHNCEAPATADALYIHRNTLDKRLRKIESLIAADWHSVPYQLQMLFSLVLHLDQEHKLIYYP